MKESTLHQIKNKLAIIEQFNRRLFQLKTELKLRCTTCFTAQTNMFEEMNKFSLGLEPQI